MTTTAVIDPTKQIGINVVCESPHVVAYKLWIKTPTTDWTVVGTGQTADEIADFFTIGPFPTGSRLAYWLGIGGHVNTPFRALVTLAQDGRIVQGGMCLEQGVTNEHHVAVVESEVVFA